MYLYGSKFKIFTDRKPLLRLLGSTKFSLPTPIQSWVLTSTICIRVIVQAGEFESSRLFIQIFSNL